ncbi:MAG: dTMP kinase [Candidatus Thermoplasmatota archaeon]|nr:dTMP kinase [Candidatus Thermoplasmatota archaeon]
MKKTAFITFEGIDGSGKSTVSAMVASELEKRGFPIRKTVEPTEEWTGKAVRQSIREGNPITTALLFVADRAHHAEQIKNWLESGEIVVCDRYFDSTFAYQTAALEGKMKNPENWLKSLHSFEFPKPDITFLFDIDPKVGLERISGREVKEKFEKLEFLEKVRKNYLSIAKRECKRIVVIDASKPKEIVAAQVLEIILDILKK